MESKSLKTEKARKKEEETKRRVETLWREAQHSELAMREAEAKLEIAQREVQEGKVTKDRIRKNDILCEPKSVNVLPMIESALHVIKCVAYDEPSKPVVNGSKDKPAKSANKASFKLKRKGRLQSTPSSTFISSNKLGNSIKPVKTVIQNKNIIKKKSKQDLPSAIYVIENVTFVLDTCLVCERCCGSRDSMKLLVSYMLEARAQQGDNNKDLDLCPVCNTSRWKDRNTPGKKVPKKVLRYFLIIPRLQCLYKSSHTTKDMIWHATRKCMEPGKMQHPVNGGAWKKFDTKYPDFPKNRNVSTSVGAVCSLDWSYNDASLLPLDFKSTAEKLTQNHTRAMFLFKQICSALSMEDDMLKISVKMALKGGLFAQMSADVAWGHGGDDGGDDRPPPYQVPTGCGGCLGNRGKGTRKPNLGGRRAGRLHTRQETRSLGPSLTCVPTWNPTAGHKSMRASIPPQNLQKIYNGKKAALKERYWVPEEDGTYDLERLRRGRPTHISEWRPQLQRDEMLRLQGLGSNTPTGVPYTEDEIMAIVSQLGGASSRGHIPGGWTGFASTGTMLNQLKSQPEYGGGSGSGGCGDDEPGDDEDDGEDEDDS
ncbi:hypothetical protein Tco_1330250 [Tanacetum coccineum]